jgi:hypothetical protein
MTMCVYMVLENEAIYTFMTVYMLLPRQHDLEDEASVNDDSGRPHHLIFPFVY